MKSFIFPQMKFIPSLCISTAVVISQYWGLRLTPQLLVIISYREVKPKKCLFVSRITFVWSVSWVVDGRMNLLFQENVIEISDTLPTLVVIISLLLIFYFPCKIPIFRTFPPSLLPQSSQIFPLVLHHATFQSWFA